MSRRENSTDNAHMGGLVSQGVWFSRLNRTSLHRQIRNRKTVLSRLRSKSFPYGGGGAQPRKPDSGGGETRSASPRASPKRRRAGSSSQPNFGESDSPVRFKRSIPFFVRRGLIF